MRPAAEDAVRLIASGSEVHLAICAAALLREKGVETAVVSMPSWELFEQQSEDYREQVLGANTRIAIEAASSFGWERYATSSRHIIAIRSFWRVCSGRSSYEEIWIHCGGGRRKGRKNVALECVYLPLLACAL